MKYKNTVDFEFLFTDTFSKIFVMGQSLKIRPRLKRAVLYKLSARQLFCDEGLSAGKM